MQLQPAPTDYGKKVAILGFTPSWRLAPFNDPDCEIWVLNEFYVNEPPRVTRWFDLHTRQAMHDDKGRTDDHVAKLAQMTVPVYMHQHWDDIPMSVEYPLSPLIAEYGRYFTNSISYMVALAIYEGFGHIGIFGVDMAHDTEYGQQRPSCEYFIGVAIGKGIHVGIPAESDLLKCQYLYGYEQQEATALDAKLTSRSQELRQKQAFHESEFRKHMEAAQQFAGALQNNEHLRKIWRSSH